MSSRPTTALANASGPDAAATVTTSGPPVARVSTLELFFDLVFVFAITQVAHLFGHAHDAIDFLRAFLVLAVVWWMYGGYAWLTSNVGTDRLQHRLLLLCGMAGFLVIALRTPAVAARHGPDFGLAYLVVVLAHATRGGRARARHRAVRQRGRRPRSARGPASRCWSRCSSSSGARCEVLAVHP